jgi:hypothetical protein
MGCAEPERPAALLTRAPLPGTAKPDGGRTGAGSGCFREIMPAPVEKQARHKRGGLFRGEGLGLWSLCCARVSRTQARSFVSQNQRFPTIRLKICSMIIRNICMHHIFPIITDIYSTRYHLFQIPLAVMDSASGDMHIYCGILSAEKAFQKDTIWISCSTYTLSTIDRLRF